MDELRPKNFQFKEQTKAAMLNAPIYVFTPLRDLKLKSMGLCIQKLPRCKVQLIETYPRYMPSHAALIENGQLIMEEKMVPAQLQILTLQEAFGREGLTAVDCDYETALQIDSYLDEVSEMPLLEAIKWFQSNVDEVSVRTILVNSFKEAYVHATAVLNVTQKEIQNARSGRMGKAYVDDRDSLFAALTGRTELSLLAPEGAAANNMATDLAGKLSAVLSGGASNTDLAKILSLIESQDTTINLLKQELASLKLKSETEKK